MEPKIFKAPNNPSGLRINQFPGRVQKVMVEQNHLMHSKK